MPHVFVIDVSLEGKQKKRPANKRLNITVPDRNENQNPQQVMTINLSEWLK